MTDIIEVPLDEFIKYLEGRIAEMREGCQNPNCPNGHKIEIAIFRGGKFCSDNCRKAIGLDPKKEKI